MKHFPAMRNKLLAAITFFFFFFFFFFPIVNIRAQLDFAPPLPPNTSSIIKGSTSPTLQNILNVCGAASQNSSVLDQCQQSLLDSLQQGLNVYTTTLADSFSFCIADPIQERDATFGFQGNLTFLKKCFDKTEGSILQYMCSGVEIKLYLDSMPAIVEGTADMAASARLPGNNCNASSSWSQGCEAGWAKSLSQTITDANQLYADINGSSIDSIPNRTDAQDIPCCEGFFCPRGLGCMIPCPLGAQCTNGNLSGGLCAPYNYPLTPSGNYSCGGANLWASLSVSRGLFCPAGFYCPSTIELYSCDKGHFCRQGSTSQSPCFRLTNCDQLSSTQHIQSYGIMLIAVMASGLLVVYSCTNKIRKIRRKRKQKTREKAIMQVKEKMSAANKLKSAATSFKRFGRTISGFHKLRADVDMDVDGRQSHSFRSLNPESANSRLRSVAEGRGSQLELQNIGESSRQGFAFHVEIEEDLYEAPVVTPQNSANDRNAHLRTRTQILMYAYDRIEKEKAIIGNKAVSGLKHEEVNANRLKIEIAFQDLCLYLKGSRKKILCNVTGKLSPGRVTAIMGPSGAGKTTFLNALAGKAYNSYTTGVILINGKQDPIKCYSKIIGFVPQDDIVHGDLTVEENLWFSARYRLPIDMPKPDKVLVVERIIDALGLQQIRNSKVGTVEKRGISGGQRKRVNVGLEMVMEPSFLILDEPTSGLDSTSSFLVLRALRREAQAGVNVGVVLHQPSYNLFRMFDDVMFLAKGGRTVYLGPVDDVEDYFASMGITVPERINPPDHFMDVLEGITKTGRGKFDATILPLKWIEFNGYEVPMDLRTSYQDSHVAMGDSTQHHAESSRNRRAERSFLQDILTEFSNFIRLNWDEFKSTFTKYEDLSNRVTPGFFAQFKTIISRIALQRVRDARVQTQDFLLLLLCGACLGVIVPSKDNNLGSNNYPYVVIALSLLCMIASLRTFTNDKLQYWRESASGINRVAYFLAKDSVDHFNTAIKPVFFLSMVYFFNNPRSTFFENYVVTLALVYCVTGIAYIFAITMQSGPAQLWSVLLPVIFTLIATQKNVPRLLKFIQYADYAKWAIEAYVISNVKRYSGVWLITRCALLYSTDYNIRNWPWCLAILFVMGFIARFVALLCLILCNRKRQQ